MALSIGYDRNVHSILGSIGSVPIPEHPTKREAPVALPFVTISRQPGAGGWTLAEQLVAEINARPSATQPWTCWDRELVERIAADLHVSNRIIERFEEHNRSWIMDFVSSLSHSDTASADDEKIYKRVAMTIRSLATAGRTVIVGRGGVFLTKGLTAGVHVRLIAPMEYRVQFMMHEKNITHGQALIQLRELEHNRNVFLKRYWNRDELRPEDFTVVYNTAVLSTEQMVKSILPMLQPQK
jgi:cytidylate kinase